MILILEKETSLSSAKALQEHLGWMGLKTSLIEESGLLKIAVVYGADKNVDLSKFSTLPHIEKVLKIDKPYKLASKAVKSERTVITIKGKTIGGKELAIMAGPCSIESEDQIFESARIVKNNGANILRGGAFKPRTSPYSFQGMGEEGLKYMKAAGLKYDMLTISEVMDGDQIELVAEYVDIIQIGARNMQNFSLLKKLGTISNPIMLKRGLAATYQDFLMAAEYILSVGNPNVILCERGIRTFETHSRNTLDIAAVPILNELSHLPVIVDPSHGTGIRTMVAPMARAAVAAGADGIMVEVHPEPNKAFSDAEQTLDEAQFKELMDSLRIIGPVVGRMIN